MASKFAGQIEEIGGCVEAIAGSEARAQFMQGFEMLPLSNPRKVALWVKEAINRLDELVDGSTRTQVMLECGYNCQRVNSRPMQSGRTRRRKYPDEESFLSAEMQNPPRGMRFEREGNLLLQFYTPRTYGSGIRCYCGLLRGLPADETVSRTYCQCSRGFVQKYWEGILGRPVQVELGETAISGAEECRFVIHL